MYFILKRHPEIKAISLKEKLPGWVENFSFILVKVGLLSLVRKLHFCAFTTKFNVFLPTVCWCMHDSKLISKYVLI